MWRSVASTALRSQQKHGHFLALDRIGWAVLAVPATGRDTLVVELFDPVRVLTRARNIRELPGRSASRRNVSRSVLRGQQKHGHFLALHRVGRTVVAAAASGCDAGAQDPFDGSVSRLTLQHVQEIGEKPIRPFRRNRLIAVDLHDARHITLANVDVVHHINCQEAGALE